MVTIRGQFGVGGRRIRIRQKRYIFQMILFSVARYVGVAGEAITRKREKLRTKSENW